MFVHEKKPVSTPGNISSNRPNTGNFDRDIRVEPITRNIRHFHRFILIEMRDNDADRRLDTMNPGSDAVQMGQRSDHADRAMSAHSQISGAIEKNYSRYARLIDRST